MAKAKSEPQHVVEYHAYEQTWDSDGNLLYDVGDKFDSEAAAAKVGVRVRPVIGGWEAGGTLTTAW